MKLQESIAMIEDDSFLTESLKGIYEQVPGGQCKGCLRCCTESVNTFFVEYVHIFQFLMNNPQVFKSHSRKISEFFLLEMVESMYCPFVDAEGRCAIYPVRPLPCRVFGNLEEDDYQKNYNKIRESNEDLAKYYLERYNLKIPEAVINRKIAYCRDFISDRKISAEERDDWVDLLFSLDSRFLMAECISFEDVNLSLVTWLIKSIMPLEEAGQMRIQAMGFWADKNSDKLMEMIDNLAKNIEMLNVV